MEVNRIRSCPTVISGKQVLIVRTEGKCPHIALGGQGILGEGRFLPGTNRFQVEGTPTILREDILCSRPWPKLQKNILHLIFITTYGNILIL